MGTKNITTQEQERRTGRIRSVVGNRRLGKYLVHEVDLIEEMVSVAPLVLLPRVLQNFPFALKNGVKVTSHTGNKRQMAKTSSVAPDQPHSKCVHYRHDFRRAHETTKNIAWSKMI